MAEVTITFPDGSKKQFESGTTALAVAESISEGLARQTLVAIINGEQKDVTTPLTGDATLEFVKFDDPRGQHVFWHSGAHLLAQAVQKLFPKAKATIGPALEEGGFYYDFAHLDVKEEDLPKIEKEMLFLAKENFPITRIEFASEKEALDAFSDNPFKQEVVKAAEEGLSAYKQGDYIDLCRGPHLPRTGMIKAVWIHKISGAYWRGDAKNEQLTRLYGTVYPDKKQLNQYKAFLEEAKKRDHRKIAAEMELYTIREEIGPGLIIWLPKGNIIKEELEKWAKETEEKWGYQRITTPVITKEGLFHTSEHLPHYADSMFAPMQIDNENYYIKPMNCPFHHMAFKARTRSYRELPLRFAEYGLCHRYEQSGALFGLMRVRGMDMNDAHIYCAKEDAVQEFIDVCKLHAFYYEALGVTEYKMVMALRDPKSDKYHGEEEMWQEAEALMREAMEKSGIPFEVEVGGAAFYGPKIDFEIKSAIGRQFSASTNQIDLFMPEKFNLTYIGEDGKEHTPACIHRAPLGTHERFIGFLIEHFAGRFPLWLAPEQVGILPIGEEQEAEAQKIHEKLKEQGIRSVMIAGGVTLNKRIRDAQLRRIPATIVIGDKEVQKGTVALRTLDGKTQYDVSQEDFVKRVVTARDTRSLDF